MTTAPHLPAKAHSTDDVHPRPKGEYFDLTTAPAKTFIWVLEMSKTSQLRRLANQVPLVSRSRYSEEQQVLPVCSRLCPSCRTTRHSIHRRTGRHQGAHSSKHPGERGTTSLFIRRAPRLVFAPTVFRQPTRRKSASSAVGRSKPVSDRAGAHCENEDR